jgi:hypothetical protein
MKKHSPPSNAEGEILWSLTPTPALSRRRAAKLSTVMNINCKYKIVKPVEHWY